ncbi:hypothetical protein Godav_019456 [Gossypium davidsonii]|uniref:Uncharacterized protein n=3 Tax=Gossypium TaxID=3633 RepID=A0A7J8QZR6_GOSDV|nr:hypothetical protein [Gossypium davidsonii]
MCYEVKCSTCGKTTWGGCGRHVPSVYNRLPETQRCNCKEWPGVNAPQPSTSCTIFLSAELYTKDVHFFNGAYSGYCFFYSLPSNAEDNEYPIDVQPTPEFVLTTRVITRTGARSTLLVFNNEVGFSRKNMDSICSVGRSTKKGKRQLGSKGYLFVSSVIIQNKLTMFQQYSETDQNTLPSDRASSCVVHPSAKENLETTDETCRYFMWRQRLKRGTSSFGVFAFLPTAMGSSSFPETRVFEFLPAQASSITELNNTKESIKIMVQKARIIPCEKFSGTKHFCKPDSVIRIHGGFQDRLNKTREFCMKIVY